MHPIGGTILQDRAGFESARSLGGTNLTEPDSISGLGRRERGVLRTRATEDAAPRSVRRRQAERSRTTSATSSRFTARNPGSSESSATAKIASAEMTKVEVRACTPKLNQSVENWPM